MRKVLILLSLFVATSALAKAWYEGGNLHKKRLSEWKVAAYSNKLATAADFTGVIFGEAKIRRMGGIDAIRPYAVDLVDCIDEAAEADVNIQVSETAASCAILMGWTN